MAKKERPEFEALVKRIASGEITRQQAGELARQQTGLSPSTFQVWLSGSEHAKSLPHANAGRSKLDPDKAKAYEAALAEAATSTMTPEALADKHGVSRGYLRKLITQQKPTPQRDSDTEQAVDGVKEADAYLGHLRLTDPERYVRIAKLAQAGL